MDIVKTTNTVDVTLTDSQNNDTTFKIDNPVSSITRADVNNAFQPMINSGKFYSRHENPFSNIASVVTTKTVVTTRELN